MRTSAKTHNAARGGILLDTAPPLRILSDYIIAGDLVQNAAVSEKTTWLPAMVDPSLVDEKFG